MAFAGNDLVNFIGVPLAGFESYREFIANPGAGADTFMMDSLVNPVKTPTPFLLAAGAIMVITLFLSKKAWTVSQTEITLARQGEGQERFSSSFVSRSLVRGTVNLSRSINRILPEKIALFVERRFDSGSFRKKSKQRKEAASFDLLRASVNMFVASMLIATGTSLKLPLSTTYVTFMVAMGTSLADRAWGRESAVYRITGVLSVITGWFITALVAFTVSLTIALIIHKGGLTGVFIMLGIGLIFIFRTNFIHKKIFLAQHRKDDFADQDTINSQSVVNKCSTTITEITSEVSKLYFSTLLNLIREDRKKMRKTREGIKALNLKTKDLKNNVHKVLRKLEEGSLESGHYYVQTLDYLREIAHCLTFISDPVFEHIENNHPPLIKEQVKDLHGLNESVSSLLNNIITIIKKQNLGDINKIIAEQKEVLDQIAKIKKKQIKLIREEVVSTRNTMMLLNILSESKNLVLYSINMARSHRDFILQDTGKNL